MSVRGTGVSRSCQPSSSATSSPSASPSCQRSSPSRPAATSRTLVPRTPNAVGQPVSQLLSRGSTSSSTVNKTPSPSYFGVGMSSHLEPPASSSGPHVRQNWERISMTSTNIPSPRPANENNDTEGCRRQSEQEGILDAHKPPTMVESISASPHAFSVPAGDARPEATSSPQPTFPVEDGARPPHQLKETDGRSHSPFFGVPRHESPTPLSPDQSAAANCRNSCLSLPTTNLRNLTPDPSQRQGLRAETLPGTLGRNTPNMIPSQQFVTLLQSSPAQVLLLDVRVAPQYSESRVREALNLCIPTTLLKRPSFNTQKLRDTFARECDREEFSHWRTCEYIAVYDSRSNNLKDAQTAINVLNKFSAEGWGGQGIILKGGFAELCSRHPSMIEQGSMTAAANPTTSGLVPVSPKQTTAPVAGGCPMPTSKTGAVPFFNNIRQNMDLLDGVGQLPVHRPAELSDQEVENLPRWLKRAVAENDCGKLISDTFLAIERTEQRRMQDALHCPVDYALPHSQEIGKVQIAGIERGAQNRYNNILPYDHSRVCLKNVPPGGSDYINASHIKASYSSKHYIATQAPIPPTFGDFWRLIWEQDVRVVVMLTAESEGGQVKCHPYWHSGDYGPLKLKLLSERSVPLELGKNKLRTSKGPGLEDDESADTLFGEEASRAKAMEQSPPERSFATVRHFALSHSNLPFEPMREITQLQYLNWPDFGAPAHPHHLLALIEHTNKYVDLSASSRQQTTSPTASASNSARAILVHCSAGCGRTGTFCTVDSVLDMLKRQRSKDGNSEKMDVACEDDVYGEEWLNRDDVDLIAKAVGDLRGHRLSMVQNLRQFVLCYESVLDWLVRRQLLDEGHAGKQAEAQT